jgi:cellobiose epimerase
MNAQGVVTGSLRTEKIWWVEAEHLNALLLLHEHLGKETNHYWDAFLKEWDWITKYQIDHTNGGWWATVQADGTPASRVKADMWTECYHQGRAMLNVSERLRKLAASN